MSLETVEPTVIYARDFDNHGAYLEHLSHMQNAGWMIAIKYTSARTVWALLYKTQGG